MAFSMRTFHWTTGLQTGGKDIMVPLQSLPSTIYLVFAYLTNFFLTVILTDYELWVIINFVLICSCSLFSSYYCDWVIQLSSSPKESICHLVSILCLCFNIFSWWSSVPPSGFLSTKLNQTCRSTQVCTQQPLPC